MPFHQFMIRHSDSVAFRDALVAATRDNHPITSAHAPKPSGSVHIPEWTFSVLYKAKDGVQQAYTVDSVQVCYQ